MQGSEPLCQGIEGKIWMQKHKPALVHILILKEEKLKASYILIFSFVDFFTMLS